MSNTGAMGGGTGGEGASTPVSEGEVVGEEDLGALWSVSQKSVSDTAAKGVSVGEEVVFDNVSAGVVSGKGDEDSSDPGDGDGAGGEGSWERHSPATEERSFVPRRIRTWFRRRKHTRRRVTHPKIDRRTRSCSRRAGSGTWDAPGAPGNR